MSDEAIDMSEVPPVPPEVEQAAMLGNTKDAVNLYMKFTDVDEETAHAVISQLSD
jgi:hypothetical protein